MRAIFLNRYGCSRQLELREVEQPRPQEGQLLIAVKATAVNDWDWCLMRGKPGYIRLLCGLRRPRVRIPGVDVAGVVASVGPGVSRFKAGDAIYGDLSPSGFGGFAEYVCVKESAVARMPSNLSFSEAAALPHAANLAWQGLIDYGCLKRGQSVLVIGAGGGVGTLALQIARLRGAGRVDGVDSGVKAGRLRELGFDQAIDYQTEDFARLPGRYDLILDAKTSRSLSSYLRALKNGGVYATVGGTTGRLLQAILLGPLLGRATGKRIRLVALKPNKDLTRVCQLCEAGELKPVVERSYSLEEAPRAVDRFGSGRHFGKVVIEVGKPDGPVARES